MLLLQTTLPTTCANCWNALVDAHGIIEYMGIGILALCVLLMSVLVTTGERSADTLLTNAQKLVDVLFQIIKIVTNKWKK